MPAASTRIRLRQPAAPAIGTGADLLPSESRSNLGLRINGSDRSIPMTAEQVAFDGLNGAAALIHAGGGFDAKLVAGSWLTIRIGLDGRAQPRRLHRRISALAGDLLQMSMDASENEGTPPCSIPGLRVHDHGAGHVDVDLYVERTDERGKAFLAAAARAIVPLLARVTECESPPLLDFITTRVAQIRVACCVDIGELLDACRAASAAEGSPVSGARVEELLRRFCSGSHQPDLAAQHNDHLLVSASAAAFELGLDSGAFVLGARSHAARWGSCEPLVNWRRRERELLGQLQLPLLVGSGRTDERIPTGRRRERAAIVDGHTPAEWVASDPLVEVACVGLAASLGFVEKAVSGQIPNRRPRTLLPPPLPARRGARPARARSEKENSESGVRPAVRDCDILRARTGADPYRL